MTQVIGSLPPWRPLRLTLVRSVPLWFSYPPSCLKSSAGPFGPAVQSNSRSRLSAGLDSPFSIRSCGDSLSIALLRSASGPLRRAPGYGPPGRAAASASYTIQGGGNVKAEFVKSRLQASKQGKPPLSQGRLAPTGRYCGRISYPDRAPPRVRHHTPSGGMPRAGPSGNLSRPR